MAKYSRSPIMATVTMTSYEKQTKDKPVYKAATKVRSNLDRKQNVKIEVRKKTSYTNQAAPPTGSKHGAYSNMTTVGVNNIVAGRDKEKKDMQDLNERFATYIEKVRFLEAQNKRLADELNKLKNKWGKETGSIKEMYSVELDEARKLINETEKEKARVEIRNDTLEKETAELRKQ